MRGAFLFLFMLCALTGHAQLSPEERFGLTTALYLGNLTPDDLKFARCSAPDRYALPIVKQANSDPLSATDQLLDLHRRASGSLSQSLKAACEIGFQEKTPSTTGPKPLQMPPTVPENLRPVLGRLSGAISEANSSIRTALKPLSESERRIVIEGLPRWAAIDRNVGLDFVTQPMPETRNLLALIEKVDLKSIRQASLKLSEAVELELPVLQSFRGKISFSKRIKVDGIVIEIGGSGADEHRTRDSNLCIDFGGANTYDGRYGAGVGYASVLIDMGDSSRFRGPDLNYGCGVLGIGLCYCISGEDRFEGKSLCFGAGMAGVGGIAKYGGNDLYRANALSEGAAAFGIGILWDSGGDDSFVAKTASQGFGRTGGFGWLISQSGDDTYRTDSGQGMGLGLAGSYLSISGGVGLLTDLGGQDTFKGGTGCQAFGKDGGLGSLYVQTGNDLFEATDQAQACAVNQGSAYFLSLSGDDSYVLHGAQGQSHSSDHSVSVFFDREGDDLYMGKDCRPATAINGSLSLFLDGAGNDRYFGVPAAAISTSVTGALGIFADLGGDDHYAEGFGKEQASISGDLAVAYSAQTSPDQLKVVAISNQSNALFGTKPLPDDPILEQLYAQAVATPVQQKAVDKLVETGLLGLQWMIVHKLDANDAGHDRPFLALVSNGGSAAAELFAKSIADPSNNRSAVALRICSTLRLASALPYLKDAIARPELRRAVVRTVGRLGAASMTDSLVPLLASDDPALVLETLSTLSALGTPDGVGTAQVFLNSPDLMVRQAAIHYVARFPSAALVSAESRIQSKDEHLARIGIQILGELGTPQALNEIVPFLSKGSVGLKIQALKELNGRCPESARAAFISLRGDLNALVRSVASRTDPGR